LLLRQRAGDERVEVQLRPHRQPGEFERGQHLHGGQGDAELETGSGEDSIVFTNTGGGVAATLTSADTVDGGAGQDALVFRGDAVLNDLAFMNVKQVETIELRQGAFILGLGTNTVASGIATVDAHLADQTAIINGSPSTLALTIIGSNQADLIQGGTKADHITGGKGGDILFGNGGNDVFVYESATESRQLAGNDLTKADVIEDFAMGDLIDVSALVSGQISVFNHGTVVNFITADTANWFGQNDIAVAYDNTNTRVYVDANHDGSFNLNQDAVIQIIGNHLNDVSTAAAYV
jgi:Ca2+-binding RTX toxin-like protein